MFSSDSRYKSNVTRKQKVNSKMNNSGDLLRAYFVPDSGISVHLFESSQQQPVEVSTTIPMLEMKKLRLVPELGLNPGSIGSKACVLSTKHNPKRVMQINSTASAHSLCLTWDGLERE